MIRTRRRRAEGFTLVELLVAITILGIIMGAIGAMIATAFRTSSTVSDELSGSRGPKMVSRYWVPDVEQAATVAEGGGGCGSSGAVVATMTSTDYISNIGTKNQAEDPGASRTVVWAVVPQNGRTQLVRFVCGGDSTTVVADLDQAKASGPASGSDSRKWTLTVTVPDRSQQDKTFTFAVDATQAVTPEPAT